MVQLQRRSDLRDIQFGEPYWSWTTLSVPSATSLAVEYGPNRQLGGWRADQLFILPPTGKSTCSWVHTAYLKVGGSCWRWGDASLGSVTTDTDEAYVIDPSLMQFPSHVTVRHAIWNNGTSAAGSGNPVNNFRIQYSWHEYGREA